MRSVLISQILLKSKCMEPERTVSETSSLELRQWRRATMISNREWCFQASQDVYKRKRRRIRRRKKSTEKTLKEKRDEKAVEEKRESDC